MIHVTHDQVEAMTMGERICIMRDGEVVQVGAPLAVYDDPIDTFVASFLATPPMNLLPGRLVAEGEKLMALAPGFTCEIPPDYRAAYLPQVGRDVIIGVRPEDLHTRVDRAGPLAAPLTVTVETVEALGPETVLMLSLPGSKEIAARVDLATRFSVGQTIQVYFDARRISLFDPVTTKRISRSP
jgi:multiple sugar transport system ATP-binding protein